MAPDLLSRFVKDRRLVGTKKPTGLAEREIAIDLVSLTGHPPSGGGGQATRFDPVVNDFREEI